MIPAANTINQPASPNPTGRKERRDFKRIKLTTNNFIDSITCTSSCSHLGTATVDAHIGIHMNSRHIHRLLQISTYPQAFTNIHISTGFYKYPHAFKIYKYPHIHSFYKYPHAFTNIHISTGFYKYPHISFTNIHISTGFYNYPHIHRLLQISTYPQLLQIFACFYKYPHIHRLLQISTYPQAFTNIDISTCFYKYPHAFTNIHRLLQILYIHIHKLLQRHIHSLYTLRLAV